MDEYREVNREMEEIIEKRMDQTNANQNWNYDKEVGRSLQQQPFKYQPV